VEYYFLVVDSAGQRVQYGYICLTPSGLTQRCAAIEPFRPTSFVVPQRIQDAIVTVYARGIEHTEGLQLYGRDSRYVITIPMS
jgi:hypothetical protein